jgi:hypothetical protein
MPAIHEINPLLRKVKKVGKVGTSSKKIPYFSDLCAGSEVDYSSFTLG